MKTRVLLLCVAVLSAAGSAGVRADDVTGADRLICASIQATACTVDEDCVMATPSDWNIPSFIEIDLAGKMLSTTAASGEPRATPIKHLEREDGLIMLQGSEAGRAFSFVVTEETGTISVAVARDGVTVSVFGACTPMPGAAPAAK